MFIHICISCELAENCPPAWIAVLARGTPAATDEPCMVDVLTAACVPEGVLSNRLSGNPLPDEDADDDDGTVADATGCAGHDGKTCCVFVVGCVGGCNKFVVNAVVGGGSSVLLASAACHGSDCHSGSSPGGCEASAANQVLVGAGVVSLMPASGPANPAQGGRALLPLAELPPVFVA